MTFILFFSMCRIMSIPKKPSEPLLVRVFIEEINAQVNFVNA